ncbi:hypothetical protein/L-gulonate 5-dehydrogenase [Thermoflavimicrobium dichotomicum]|uniref:Enoyl reductase (ER) domain-containing protein n=2 Tax=Thermoflavimicrobium dichotomicum TaxID=46223 RepID=A0A1I3L2M6_9BACL|nr:hypothetical protein/L-gulonate 5-dehydrogenase [Thermoflavimicrobium dichotomicum]
MLAAVMEKPFSIHFKEVARPQVGPHDVLVRIKAAGICGSDVHFYDGSNPYANYPQIFGHELSGIIEEVGSQVKERKVGERVVVEPAIPCGRCYPCRVGKPNACGNIDMIGSVRPGGFAEFLLVPEAHVHVMPDEMSFEIGALCEPFTIGRQAIQRADIQPGQTVTILGMGPIGLTILAQLKQEHDVNVFAVDVVPERLEISRRLGADVLINAKDVNLLAEMDRLTGGEGSNIVIEAAGLPLTIEQTIHLVSPGGRIVIVGLTGKDVTFPGQLLTKKNIELFGTRHSVNQFPEVLRFLSQNRELAESFITEVMPFQHIESALKKAKNHPDKVVKIVLTYQARS